MSQYGRGPTVYKTGRSTTDKRAIHADEGCRYLHNGNRNPDREVLEKPLPSLAHLIVDGDMPTCDECWPGSDMAAVVESYA